MRKLELQQDMKYQIAAWRVERAGWCLIGALILGTLFGAFGSDSLTQSHHLNFQIGYARFARYNAELKTEVIFSRVTEPSEISISQDYVDMIRLTDITPWPSEVTATADKVLYRFNHLSAGARVTFHYRFEKRGLISARIGVGPEETSFKQWVYP